MFAANQDEINLLKAKKIVQAYRAFAKAQTVRELLSAAISAKIAGDEVLLNRFRELMAKDGVEVDLSVSFEKISEEELDELLKCIDSPCE